MSKKILLAIVMLVLSLSSIGVEFVTIKMYLKAQAAKNWPQAEGTITKSEVVREEVGKILYKADVEYDFVVDDKEFHGDIIRLRGKTSSSHNGAEEIVAKYPVGAQVQVFYSADDASDALLEPGADLVNYIIMISPLFFAGLFGFCAYGAWLERSAVK